MGRSGEIGLPPSRSSSPPGARTAGSLLRLAQALPLLSQRPHAAEQEESLGDTAERWRRFGGAGGEFGKTEMGDMGRYGEIEQGESLGSAERSECS